MGTKNAYSIFVIAVVVTALALLPASVYAGSWHTVKQGESLWRIATQHGATVDQLQQANTINRSLIYPGQRLLVPAPGQAVHWVRAGDSLHKIANAYGTSVQHLVNMNGLSSHTLSVGQRLVVPVATQSRSRSVHASLSVKTRHHGLANWELDLLARTVSSEAKGEPYAGQVAVASVVLNRVRSSQFPNSIRGVVYQRHQFEPVMNGSINDSATRSAINAARDAVNGWDPSYGALYFWNPSKANNSFLWSRPFTVHIGGHRFAR